MKITIDDSQHEVCYCAQQCDGLFYGDFLLWYWWYGINGEDGYDDYGDYDVDDDEVRALLIPCCANQPAVVHCQNNPKTQQLFQNSQEHTLLMLRPEN